jgi:hypothetical protein
MIFSPAECPNFIDGTLVGCNGTSSQGTIVCLDSLNNFIGYQTTVNGSFHLSTPVGTFRLLAYEGTFGATSIAQVVTGQSCNVGNVPLCDSLNTGNNLQLNFTGIFGTMSSSFTVQACSVDSGSIPAVMSFIQYDPTTQRYLKVKLRMPSYANGTYSWNQSFLSLEGDMIASGTVYHLVGDQTTNGKTTMTSTPPFGGMMQGSFSGPITLTNNAGLSLSGSVQATFNIYRNH